MADRSVKLQMGWGQFLLSYSAMIKVPERIGDIQQNSIERNIIQGLIAKLWEELGAYSPWIKEYEPGKSSKIYFGPKEEWDEPKAGGRHFAIKDIRKIIQVRLSRDALNGAAWLCVIACSYQPGRPLENGAHFDGAPMVSPSEYQDTVKPLLKAIGKWESVADGLGLNKIDTKKHCWPDDPAPAEEEVAAADPKGETRKL